MSEELWKVIDEFPTYEVSTLGRVRRNGKVRATYVMSPRSYRRVGLFKDGVRYERVLHVLVARAFLGEKPHGQSVRFKDKDMTNCRLSNLEYRNVDTLPVKIPGRRPRA